MVMRTSGAPNTTLLTYWFRERLVVACVENLHRVDCKRVAAAVRVELQRQLSIPVRSHAHNHT